MLLISEEGLDREELIEKAEKYGVVEAVESLISYLENKGKEKSPKQPEWEELEKLAEEYGVGL